MYDVNIISTGSAGNCVQIDRHIMLDAGLSKKKIQEAGCLLEDIQLLYITHKHADHAVLPTIRWFIKQGIDVYIPNDIVVKINEEGKLDLSEYLNINVFTHEGTPVNTIELNGTTYEISTHPQRHHDIINYAIVIAKDYMTTNDENEEELTTARLLYSTDLDTVEPTDIGPGLVNLGKFDVIILEGNYDELWLREYITVSIDSLDPEIDGSKLTDEELEHWVRANYRQLPRHLSAGLFRAVQNRRHLSKQQARLYVANHLNRNGIYYEVHRSSMFYERPAENEISL